MAESNVAAARKPAYVPFKTFENFLDKLKANSVPARIDKSVITLSGSTTAWLLSALKYLELIDDDGIPSSTLQNLVNATEEERQSLYKQLCEQRYDFIFVNHDLAKATTAQIEECFRDKGMKGSTITKALAFFLTLAENGGIETASHIKKTGSTPRKSATRKRKPRDPGGGRTDREESEHKPPDGYVSVSIPVGLEDAWTITMPKGAEVDEMLRFIKMVALTFNLDLSGLAR